MTSNRETLLHQEAQSVRWAELNAAQGITIETNPISNLLVGDLGDLTSHPLWRLCPIDDRKVHYPLRMCIGSDDPLPFVTNLREEYQFLHDAIILANRSHFEARRWLDNARKAGMESRFTLNETRRVP